MKKKVFSLMMMLLLAFMGVAKAEVVTIGEGTSTTYVTPFNSLWGYSFVEQIFTADEIGTAGTINAISFNMSSTDSQTNQVDVFMKAVTRTSFSGTSDYETVTASDMVFSGTVTFNNGWTTITLSTPFEYDGTSNLMIGMHEYTSGYSTRYFYYTSATDKVLSYHSDSANPDPYNLGSYSGSSYVSANRANVQINITPAEGGDVPGGQGDQLHVKYVAEDGTEVIDTLNLGVRPVGAWMEPFTFTMYSEGPTYNVTVLDFTPNDGMFSVEGQELPFQVAPNGDVDLTMAVNGTQAGIIERQFVAITEGNRAAHIWPVTVELYSPECPDVVEVAYDFGVVEPGFSYVGVPADITPTTLHDDYTLPFPEIPEGVDAVYKLTFEQDQLLNAYVSQGENGKVALYTADFYGEGGPMAHNYYQGPGIGGSGLPFEAMIGDESSTSVSSYFPFHVFFRYSIGENLFLASELAEAGVTTAPMTSLSWYVDNTTCTQEQNNISIWMANVDDTEIPTMSHITSDMTLVYTGSGLPAPVEGWNEFVLNGDSFSWDGESNVLIVCQRNNGEYQGRVNWKTHNPGFYAMGYKWTDGSAYDMTTESYSLTRSNTNRANIIMKGGNRNRDVAVDFEGGLPAGWTTIDADGDGHNWIDIDNFANEYSYYTGMAIDWYHGGSNAMLSASYINQVGALTPDNYLVSPQVTLGAGSSISFWMAAADEDYPTEHFGVFVSDDGTSNWTMVQEWTMTAKSGGRKTNSRATRGGEGLRIGNWYNYTVDLSAYTGQKYVAIRHFNSYDQYILCLDDVTIVEANTTPGPTPTPGGAISAGPVIENLPVTPGTYYLVASSTDPDFEVTINAEQIPCPAVEEFAFGPTPPDDYDEAEPASVTLHWNIPPYATGWRLIFGSTYHPQPGHPQTIMYPADGSFSNDLANSFTVRNLWNNTNYFWHVEFNNDGCPEGVSSPIWGFTTHLNIPNNLRVEDETIFEGEDAVLLWDAVVDRTYRMYNVYQDGELIGHTTVNDISDATYTVSGLTYNMTGYTFQVSAVYDEGESALSDPVVVKVSGEGEVNGHVYEQDGETGIAGATVTFNGTDEFGVAQTYTFITDAQGYYSGSMYVGSYNGQAGCEGYQTVTAPVQGNPVVINYQETTSPIDFILDENFTALAHVCAELVEVDGEELVKVWWDFNFFTTLTEDFEDWDNTPYTWQNDATYPWSLTTDSHSGNYAFRSGNAGVASSSSTLEVAVDIPQDGIFSFWYNCQGEGSYTYWDHCDFFIDGTQIFTHGADLSGWNEYSQAITGGMHTFKWSYTKDGSVNPTGDCFTIDDITFVGGEGRGDRALNHYRIYRTDCYNDGPYTEENTVLLATAWRPDTAYIDVSWPLAEPGVYKWGVGVVYEGNRGEMVESAINWVEPAARNDDFRVFEGGDVPENSCRPVSGTDAIADYVPNRGNATVILTAGDNWGDGSGYQMLLDADATAYGTVIPETGALSMSCSGNDAIYAAFEYKIPENADGNCATQNIVINNSVSIEIPAGTYDWCITNPTPGDRIWIAASNGNVGGRQNDYVFEEGMIYEFIVTRYGNNDGVDVTITDNPNPTPPTPPTPGSNINYLALPRESETIWSNMCSPCIDKDMELEGLVTVNVLLNSADSPDGTVVTFTNLNEGEQLYHPIDPITLDSTGHYIFESFRKGDYAIEVTHAGYETINDTVSIWEARDLRYVMIEIIYGVENLYVSRTGWAMWEDMSGSSPVIPTDGDAFSVDFESGMPAGWTTIDADGDGYNWVLGSAVGGIYLIPGASLAGSGHNASGDLICSGSYENNYYQALHPDNYLVSPQVNLVAGSTFSFWACGQDASYAAEHFGVFVSDNGTSDWTMVQEWTMTAKSGGNGVMSYGRDGNNRVQGNWYQYSVDLSAYAGQKYIAIRHFNCTDQFILDVDDIALTTGAKNDDRHLEYYKVMCESIDHEPIFNANTVHPFCQVATDQLVEGETYICKVAAVYSTGMSAYTEVEWQYEPCSNYAGTVDGVTVDGNTVSWTYPEGGDDPNPPIPPTGDVTVILTAGDNWGDGSGYQMLLDADANAYGSTIPETGALSLNCSGNEAIYAEFEYKIPENADGNCSTQNIVFNNSISITIPAGTYDWCITNPTPGDRIWIAASNGNVGGRQNDYVFEAGKTYEFTVTRYGNNDGVDVTISDGRNAYRPAASCIQNVGEVKVSEGNHYVADLSSLIAPSSLVPSQTPAVTGHANRGDIAYACNAYGGTNPTGWISYDLDTPNNGTALNGGLTVFGGDLAADGYVYATYNDNTWKKIDPLTGTVAGQGSLSDFFVDCAYDYTTNTMYGSKGGILYTWNLETNVITEVGSMGVQSMQMIACDLNGQLYGIEYSTGNFRRIDKTTGATTLVGATGHAAEYVQSGGFNHNDGTLYWAGYNTAESGFLATIDLTTGQATIIANNTGEQLSWCVPFDGQPTPPEPTGNVLGAMIFVDGEWEAFVPTPTNSYTYEGDGNNMCVRMVYDGTAVLPANNFYYAMSCEECVEINPEVACAPGAPIYAESLGETDQVKIYWGVQDPEPPTPDDGDTFVVDFESGMPAGWTTIDADGDGNNWSDLGMDGHNGGACISSQSYINYVGPLTPDNYLVSPAVTLGGSSTFSFWACAQDANYAAEHFGVAVSDDGVNFTTIQEWTISAKGAVNGAIRDGRDQSTWIQYTVDLSAYAGEGRYIAIRHFNCTDQFYLNVDDIELANAGRSRDGIVKYNVYRSADNAAYELIAEVPAVEGQTYYEYIDTPEVGTYYYQVRADYGECESEPAVSGVNPDVNYVTAEVTGIDELSNVALYPNPTNSNVTIEAAGMRHITVTSVLGQVVYDAEVDNDQVILNMSQYNAGVYVVRVATANGVSTHRVTVVR